MDPITLGGAIFTIINISLLINAHGRKVWVPRVGDWEEAPRVLVSRSGRVSLEVVALTVDYWRALGHELQDPEYTDEISGPIPGAIFVGPASQAWKDGLAGRATWQVQWPEFGEDVDELPPEEYRSKAEEIIEIDPEFGIVTQAVVEVDPALPEWDLPNVLIHEFGHALGYLHCETALLGRRKKDRKNGKAKAGDARRFLGLKVIARKSGHVMHPLLSKMGSPYDSRNQRGLREDEDEPSTDS